MQLIEQINYSWTSKLKYNESKFNDFSAGKHSCKIVSMYVCNEETNLSLENQKAFEKKGGFEICPMYFVTSNLYVDRDRIRRHIYCHYRSLQKFSPGIGNYTKKCKNFSHIL